MDLKKGKSYAARFQLSKLDSFIATNKVVTKMLTDFGFVNVFVSGAGELRNATGQWGKEDNPNTKAPDRVTILEIKELP